MKVIKEELESRNWIWFKAFERKLLVNLLKAQDFFLTWRASLRSIEFWNLSWLWTSFLMKICSLRIRFAVGHGARKKLMAWVSSRVPKRYVVKGFPDCFKDGILLCALTEKLVNGACPRYDLLDPDQPLRNLKLALHLVKKHIKIKTVITADEILQGGKFSEKRLTLLVAQMKLASEKFNLSNSLKLQKDYMSQTTFVSDKCFARGMGLLLAVRGRKACFTILLDSTDNLDMVIEIRGPKNTACNKRITSAFSLSRNDSVDIRDIKDAQIQEAILSKRIPLAYTILGRKISVNYTPLESGAHHMSIIWQGQHIMGSPYTITVDSSIESPDIWYMPTKRGYSRLRRSDSQYYDESIDYRNEPSLPTCPESAGTVTRKRVLRYIVRMDGNDVVIDGKEDLCKAINCIKHQQYDPSSSADENSESRDEEDFNSLSRCESENIKNSVSEIDSVSYHSMECGAAFEEDVKNNFPYFVNKADINTESEFKDPLLLKSDKTNVSGCSNNRAVKKSEETYIGENKNIEPNFESKKTHFKADIRSNKDLERSVVNENSGKEGIETGNQSIKTTKEAGNGRTNLAQYHETENKPQLRVSFADEEITESDSTFSPSDCANNSLNPDIKYLHPQTDDINFFPVHKVEYESLHDDDIEDLSNCNQGRRMSFTELNESNYLDEDVNEIEPASNELLDENFSFSTEKQEGSEKESEVNYQRESKDYDGADIRECLKANHSLFQCDHSLSLFTDSVVETPPEYAVLEYGNRESMSEDNASNAWENELKVLKDEPSICDNGKSVESEKGKSSGSSNLEYAGGFSSLMTFYDFNDSENLDPFSFQYTDLNKSGCEEFDLNKKSNLQDFVENRKRPSWSDRDLLPSIRESSVEGLLESESYDDKIRNREISENISYFSETKIKSRPDPQYVAISSAMSQNVAQFEERPETPLTCSSNKGLRPFLEKSVDRVERLHESGANTERGSAVLESKAEDPQNNGSSEDASKSSFSSMNVLSAFPYKNTNQSMKHSEVKFSPVTKFEMPSTQILSTDQPTTLSNSPNKSKSFILTYATPAVVEECENLNEASKKIQEEFSECISDKTSRVIDYHDSGEQKSAQCLSVKKVIQIFQKEKEEPVDTWPTENESFRPPYSRKKLKDDIFIKKDERNNSLESENCLFAPFVEISRSSIKDRVKLFESDEGKPPPIRKYSSTDKRASSSISAKKNYWENIAS